MAKSIMILKMGLAVSPCKVLGSEWFDLASSFISPLSGHRTGHLMH